jgi:hypothetical protein
LAHNGSMTPTNRPTEGQNFIKGRDILFRRALSEREGATPGSARKGSPGGYSNTDAEVWKEEGMPAKKGDFLGGECRNVRCASKICVFKHGRAIEP